MPRLTIDGKAVDAPAGSSVLDAARLCGLDIPSLCYRSGYHPNTSCMLCLVRLKPADRLVPSCATPAEDGMEVESETPQIRALRRTGLELLLSDHAGDCAAPCEHTCPLRVDLPTMLRQVAAGDFKGAIATIRRDMALPAVLGRVCDAYCEKGCRRSHVDTAASICLIKRHVADADLASDQPYLPPIRATGGLPASALTGGQAAGGTQRVAIVGAGPAGLSAAYHLLLTGHACVLFDAREAAGGMLRTEFDPTILPPEVLDAEIRTIERLGAEFRLGVRLETRSTLSELREQFDAVVLATGAVQPGSADVLGLPVVESRAAGVSPAGLSESEFASGTCVRGCIKCNGSTHQTDVAGVFAAGDLVRPARVVVRAVADGKAAAACVDQYLTTGSVRVPPREFSVRLGRLTGPELAELMKTASTADRVIPADGRQAGLSEQEARAEAQRCLQCDCGAKGDCRLRHYAQLYEARPAEFRGQRRPVGRQLQAGGVVVYEPGKCILCGLCVQAAQAAGEKLGLTFVGRGFSLRVDVPFGRPLVRESLAPSSRDSHPAIADQLEAADPREGIPAGEHARTDSRTSVGLERAAAECVRVCPSGALTDRNCLGCGECHH